jgi:hypothetical protein
VITLAEISQLARALLEADRAVMLADEELKQRKEAARILREESLPMALLELGLREVRLESGEKISIKQDVFAAIPAARREEAFNWLEAHGFGGLIKTAVALRFSKGELEQAQDLYEDLLADGFAPELTREVHAQTLKAFLREQLEAATVELPLELFGANPIWVAKISQ